MQKAAKTEPCQGALAFLLGMGSVGALSGQMLSTDCFPVRFSVTHLFHNKKIIFDGIETHRKNCKNSHENHKKVSELCSLSVHHSHVLLGIHSGGTQSFCPHQHGGFCAVWAGAVP